MRCDAADHLVRTWLQSKVKRLVFVAEFWQVRQGKTFLVAGNRNKVLLSFSKRKTWLIDTASAVTCHSLGGRLCAEAFLYRVACLRKQAVSL